jgi:hypothetical protein
VDLCIHTPIGFHGGDEQLYLIPFLSLIYFKVLLHFQPGRSVIQKTPFSKVVVNPDVEYFFVFISIITKFMINFQFISVLSSSSLMAKLYINNPDYRLIWKTPPPSLAWISQVLLYILRLRCIRPMQSASCAQSQLGFKKCVYLLGTGGTIFARQSGSYFWVRGTSIQPSVAQSKWETNMPRREDVRKLVKCQVISLSDQQFEA